MDLFGEQSVQVVATTVYAALVLLTAGLLMLLSVRLARLAIEKPMLARVPLRTGRLVLSDQSEKCSDAALQRSLPTRGPPGSSIHGTSSPPPPRPSGPMRIASA